MPVHLITANRLGDGVAVWLDAGQCWPHIENAAAADEATLAASLEAAHLSERDNEVVGVREIDAEVADGESVPVERRKRLRASENVGLTTDIIARPGLDYCSLATARSIPVAQRIAERFADPERQRKIDEIDLNISGCINACGHDHVGHIGLLGVDKNGEEVYQIPLRGSSSDRPSIGSIIGPSVLSGRIIDAIEAIVDVYVAERVDGEAFNDTYRRIGAAPFKEAMYGAD
jgi:sulfite reductase beta subunit-like hemoprotein